MDLTSSLGSASSMRAGSQSSTSHPTVPGGQSESAAQFATMLNQAKARLENPLGNALSLDGSSESGNEGVDLGFGGVASGVESNISDEFSQVDAINMRIFSEIRSTIQTKLDQLKTQQALRESGASASTIADHDLNQLFLVASKIGELYAASDSISYKKTAEKTLTKIILKLSVEAEKGSLTARNYLQQLVDRIPSESAPGTVLTSIVDAMEPDRDVLPDGQIA